MAVYDRSYARWDGDRSAPVRGASVITFAGLRHGVAKLFRRKFWAVILVLYAYAAFLLWMGVLYGKFYVLSNAENFGAEIVAFFEGQELLELIAVNGTNVFFYLTNLQMPIVGILIIAIGAGLVSEDRRTNALELYLSRPLGAGRYLLGKLATMSSLIAAVTLAPLSVIVLFDLVLSSTDPDAVARLVRFFPRVVGAGLVVVLVPSMFAVAVSSLTRRARNAAIGLLATTFMLEVAVAQALREVFRNERFLLFSPLFNIRQMTAWILQSEDDLNPDVPIEQTFVVLAAFALACLFVARRRVRPVEIVA